LASTATTTSTDETDSAFFQADDSRDGIAEPIYHLISEVFELRGVFGWLRRTLVTFVQITYGRTINRFVLICFCHLLVALLALIFLLPHPSFLCSQLRDVVSSLFTDQAVLSYVQTLVKTWWPDGSLLPPAPQRSTDEKKRTK
jgi:sorting nexin-25